MEVDEDCEVIKDNKNNGNKLNISNKRAELSYNGKENTAGLGLDRDEGSIRDATYRGQTPEQSLRGCTRTATELELNRSRVGLRGLELTWCYICNNIPQPLLLPLRRFYCRLTTYPHYFEHSSI